MVCPKIPPLLPDIIYAFRSFPSNQDFRKKLISNNEKCGPCYGMRFLGTEKGTSPCLRLRVNEKPQP
jgi:hypothetical protein